MSIFSHLGLHDQHRSTEKKTTQLVKHWDEVPESRKKGKRHVAQVKKDGVCAITVIQKGAAQIFSRTGKMFTSAMMLTQRIESMGLPDGVYMGEMWMPKYLASLEQVSGATNPNRVNPLEPDKAHIPENLSMAFFDLLSIESFIEGASQTTFERRHSNLTERFKDSVDTYGYPNGVSLLAYDLVESEEHMDELLQTLVNLGEEGIVIRDLDADWVAGHKGWRVMKKVRGVDYDLLCTGWEEGTGKYEGKVANLLFKWKGGKTIKAMLGKGWTHDMAEQMYRDIVVGSQEDSSHPVGKIFQVYALEESSKGKLRLVKVGERRHDKSEPDVH